MKTSTLDVLIWVLIYGGFIVACIGLSVQRTDDSLGTTVLVIGAVVAAIGVLLIYVRSRMKEDSSPTQGKTP